MHEIVQKSFFDSNGNPAKVSTIKNS